MADTVIKEQTVSERVTVGDTVKEKLEIRGKSLRDTVIFLVDTVQVVLLLSTIQSHDRHGGCHSGG